MSITLNSHVSFQGTAAGLYGPSAPIATTGGAGTLFAVYVAWGGPATGVTVTDSLGNAYVPIGVPFNSGFGFSQWFYCVAGTGGAAHTWICTPNSLDTVTFFAENWTGFTGVVSLDRNPGANLDSATPFTSNLTGTTSTANEVALVGAATNTPSGIEALTWQNSFTAIDAQGDSNHVTGGVAYLLLSATGSYQSSLTSSVATDAASWILTFQGSGGGGGAAPGGDFSQSPIPYRQHAPRIDNWDPLPALLVQLPVSVDCAPPLVPIRARREFAGWDPLPALLPLPISSVAVDCAPPLVPPRFRAPVAAWDPLPALPAPTVTPAPVFSDSPLPSKRRALFDNWEPLPSLPGEAVFSDSPLPRRMRAVANDNWNPLPAVALPTTVAWGFSQAQSTTGRQRDQSAWEPVGSLPTALTPLATEPSPPIAARLRRAVVNDWAPLPALLSPPALGPAVEPQAPLPPPLRRPPLETLGPLPALPAVMMGPAVEPQAPAPPRARRPLPDALLPLPALPLAAVGPDVAPAPAPKRPRAPQDNYDPIGRLGTPSIELAAPVPSTRIRRPEPGWEPLAALPLALPGVAFTESPVPARRRSPVVQAFAPLAAIVLPPSLPSGYECGSPLPVRSHRAAVPQNWTPLSDLIPPIPQTNQPYLLAAV